MPGWLARWLLGCVLLSPPCTGLSVLGSSVSVWPQSQGHILQVLVQYSVLATQPCPPQLEGLCWGGNCTVSAGPLPPPGLAPHPGWCLLRGEIIVPDNHSSQLQLKSSECCWAGSDSTQVVLSLWAQLSLRSDTGTINNPPQAALPPPIRVSVGCPRQVQLSVWDADGDNVRCRYGHRERGECQRCSQSPSLRLDEEHCVLQFSGSGSEGLFSLELMVEDFAPRNLSFTPSAGHPSPTGPLSSTPFQITVIVEGGGVSCVDSQPVLGSDCPPGGTRLAVLPYQLLNFTVTAHCRTDRVSDVAVVGPPGLKVSTLHKTNQGEGAESRVSLNIVWLRGTNQLPPLLPVCFSANTAWMQSELHCVWIEQKPPDPTPPGTVLQCGRGEMMLSMPLSSLPPRLPSFTLQLQDPACAITANTTHLLAHIPLQRCGTHRLEEDSAVVYVNILRSRPGPSSGSLSNPITRSPILLFPLACRYSRRGRAGSRAGFTVVQPPDSETFGQFYFWLEFSRPGRAQSRTEQRRWRGVARAGPTGQGWKAVTQAGRGETLQLSVCSNSSETRAELLVESCEGRHANGSLAQSLVQRGCVGNSSLQVLSQDPSKKIYMIQLDSLLNGSNEVFVQCSVRLCVSHSSSQHCPLPCAPPSTLQLSAQSQLYTVRTGPILITGQNASTAGPSDSTGEGSGSRAAVGGAVVLSVAALLGGLALYWRGGQGDRGDRRRLWSEG
ncbi:uncharacterized protein LOC136747508 [Amia ocellicauda]|uniref:uncharacterized protein LOC136747508 n=1 Tax=Amia ocellicauda TaxID=2972642 RepID=UPI003464247C